MTEVRRVTPDDWPLWRALRQEALGGSPSAFGPRPARRDGGGDRGHPLGPRAGAGGRGAGGRLTPRLPARIGMGALSGQQSRAFGPGQRLGHEAERLGYEWVSLFDHYRPPISGPDGLCLDGPSLLSALAATTP